MSKLVPIKRNGDGWGEYCRIAAQAFKDNLESEEPWDPNKQPDDSNVEHFLYVDEADHVLGLLSVRHTEHDFVYVNVVAIDPSNRHRGHGRSMMRDFEQSASMRYDGAWLHCALPVKPFYTMSGYEETTDQAVSFGYVTMARRFTPKAP